LAEQAALAALSPGAAIFVGFDSAWADKKTAPGAICSVLFDGEGFADFRPPELKSFNGALDYIRDLQRPDMPTLVALDQPTIVPNTTSMRPAEKVAASLISWMGGGVQPANSGLRLFREDAPIWRFLKSLNATEDPEAARTAGRGLHLNGSIPSPRACLVGHWFLRAGKGTSLQSRAPDIQNRALERGRRRWASRSRKAGLCAGGRVAGRATDNISAEKIRSGSPRRGDMPSDRDPMATGSSRTVGGDR
jgi:hypothetical protein